VVLPLQTELAPVIEAVGNDKEVIVFVVVPVQPLASVAVTV
jgi:hypothetical protein